MDPQIPSGPHPHPVHTRKPPQCLLAGAYRVVGISRSAGEGPSSLAAVGAGCGVAAVGLLGEQDAAAPRWGPSVVPERLTTTSGIRRSGANSEVWPPGPEGGASVVGSVRNGYQRPGSRVLLQRRLSADATRPWTCRPSNVQGGRWTPSPTVRLRRGAGPAPGRENDVVAEPGPSRGLTVQLVDVDGIRVLAHRPASPAPGRVWSS